MLAETSMHHSSPPFSHYSLYGAQPSLTTPIHHPSSPLSSPTSSTGSTMTPSPDDDRPPDLPCALRFGDIPAASFPAAGARGVLHSPTAVQLLSSSEMSPKGEVKVLSRSLSKLGKKNAAESVRNEDAASSDGIAVPIPSLSSSEPSCCAGCMVGSPALPEAFLALQKFLPSNNVADDDDEEDELWSPDSWPALDVYSCDEFRMYEFKVRKCVRGRSHDWTECPFAHPGEKARRRDPRRYRYSGTACPDFRKGNCRRGESCEYSHGVFECWLHPTRYRTQPCKDGKNCRRRVCFFAHTPEQLRVVPTEGESPPTTPGSGSSGSGSARSSLLKAAALSGGAYDGSPLRRALAGTLDGSVALELLLDDANKCAAGCHHHHHHWGFGAGSSPSSTLVGLSTGATSPSPMSSPVLPQGSPLVTSVNSWSAVPGHRRHLDRLRSIPRISIPGSEDSSCSPPQESQHTMAELLSTLQSMQLSPGPTAAQSCRTLPSNAWPFLSQLQNPPSQSAPNTPKPRYAVNQTNLVQVNSAEAVTSPYAMKPVTPATNVAASSLNSLSAASSHEISALESDAPDLGWVNDLVQ